MPKVSNRFYLCKNHTKVIAIPEKAMNARDTADRNFSHKLILAKLKFKPHNYRKKEFNYESIKNFTRLSIWYSAVSRYHVL